MANKENNIRMIEDKQKSMEEIREVEMHGSFLRSKVKWIEESEKRTKYFLGLDTVNYVNKNNSTDKKSENEYIHDIRDQKDILKELENYYSDLYKEKGVTDINLQHELSKYPELKINRLEQIESEA